MPTLRLLGPATWQQSDGSWLALGSERRHQMLALLGFEATWVGRDRLAALFWPNRPTAAARANLRKVLHELRELGLPGLQDGRLGLCWMPGSDVDLFRQAWGQGQWQAAADRGAGTLMQGLEGSSADSGFALWLQAQREEWQQRWRAAVLKAAGLSDAAQAWALVQRLLDVDALDEEAMALALRATAALQRPELAQGAWQRHVQALHDELGAQPAAALRLLAERAAPSPLAQPGPLLGRHSEVQALCAMLASAHLVTVLGPGGVGKSRLTRHAANLVAARFVGGAVLVPLEDARTPDELPLRVAAAMGLSLAGTADPLQTLARCLAPQSLLLVLDGFEAVIDAGPALVQLLAAAPSMRILVSSRERLGLEGEWLLPLQGLAPPLAGASDEEVLANPAVALFMARAQAINPAFDAAVASAPVAEICRRLEGLPLALELAASWVRLMPAAQVNQELARGLELLFQGQRPGSGEGLQALFERSWALLTAAEREAQARLAVFRGGFSRQAAWEVASVSLPMLAALADKSMLHARSDGRLGMHALLLHAALIKLAQLPGAATLQERHSRWYLALTLQASADLSQEHDNLLAAWQAAVARKDAPALQAVLFTLPWSVVVGGRLHEATELLSQAAQELGTDAATAALLRALQAWTLLWQEQRPQATALARSALATLRGTGNAPGMVMALRTLGHAARMDGQHALAAQQLAEGAEHARQAGLVAVQALMLDGLAMALNMRGQHAQARAAVQEAMQLNRAVDGGVDGGLQDGQGSASVQHMYNQYNLSQSHSLDGQAAQALPWAEQALATAQRIGHLYFVPYVCIELAGIALALQRPRLAQQQLMRARQVAIDHHDLSAVASTHEAGARVALALGDAHTAWQEVASAARLCLQRDNVVTGAALVLTAARVQLALHKDPAAALLWLRQLLALGVVQEPVRREAAMLLQAQTPADPAPRRCLQELLAELIALG